METLDINTKKMQQYRNKTLNHTILHMKNLLHFLYTFHTKSASLKHKHINIFLKNCILHRLEDKVYIFRVHRRREVVKKRSRPDSSSFVKHRKLKLLNVGELMWITDKLRKSCLYANMLYLLL